VFLRNLKVTLSVFIGLISLNSLAVVPKYPVLSEVQGQVWLTGKDGKKELAKAKTILREKAVLQTSATGFVKILLDEVRSVTLLASSEVSIPAISWEGGEAPVIFLRSGDIYWEQSLTKAPAYNTALRSDLFEFIAAPGDYVLSINSAKAYASVKMLEGSMVFSAMNAEEHVTVKKGQQVGFQGVLEEGEIAYDILLKGKKIPKGHLTAITAVDASELNKKAENLKKQEAAKAAQSKKDKAAAAKSKKEGYICTAPSGKFNQCAWICQGNPKSEKKRCLAAQAGVACVRTRCNANGVWAEETALDAEKASRLCQASPVVAACDY
jgi:hypothetical protein